MRNALVLILVSTLGCGDDVPAVECEIISDCEDGEVCLAGSCVPGEDAGPDTGMPDAGEDDAGDDAGMPDGGEDAFDAGESCSAGPPVVLYEFEAGDDATQILDRAPADPDVPLTDITGEITIVEAASLVETRGARMAADQAASDALMQAMLDSGSFTVEVWTRALDLVQEEPSGPERIVTLSLDSAERAFTLGHDEGNAVVRLQTDGTNAQGTQCTDMTSSVVNVPGVFTALDPPKHMVLVFSGTLGEPRVYINGEVVPGEWPCGMNMLGWTTGVYRFAIGDELTGQRGYDGQIHRVAIYDRAMGAPEVQCWYEPLPAPTSRRALTSGKRSLPFAGRRHRRPGLLGRQRAALLQELDADLIG